MKVIIDLVGGIRNSVYHYSHETQLLGNPTKIAKKFIKYKHSKMRKLFGTDELSSDPSNNQSSTYQAAMKSSQTGGILTGLLIRKR